MQLYQHEWKLGKREIVWKHDARREECFHTISSFLNFHECSYNCFLLIYLALPTRAGSPQQQICQLLCLWALSLPNPPCQLSLWEETGAPGENPRLSAER
jgi:hypothetical protein